MDSTERRIQLALKKQALLQKSAQQRHRLIEQSQPLLPLFALADRLQRGANWLKRHPALPVAALTALVAARPRTVFRWLQRGWLLWKMIRKLNPSSPQGKEPGLASSFLTGLLLKWLRPRA